ncbi:MAG: dipeptidase [Verrucomicrobiota bacterium]
MNAPDASSLATAARLGRRHRTWLRAAIVAAAAAAAAVNGFGQPAGAPAGDDGVEAALRARADKLHREAIVIDTHNDVTSAMVDTGFDLAERGDDPGRAEATHTDLRRMQAGGLDAEFFAIFVDARFVTAPPAQGGGAARRAMDMIDLVLDQAQRHADVLEMAYTAGDIQRIAASGKIAALMGIEGGHAIENSLHALRLFYRLGVRYMTLTHVNSNDWADSEADSDDPAVPHHDGLSDFGREVVREMNRLGMMVDISHVADQTFYNVIDTSRAPVIASHSSARAVANHPRNLSDDMLRALARNDGVVMVNFFDGFLDPRKAELALKARRMRKEVNRRYPDDPKRADAEADKWLAANSPGPTPLSVLIDHIDHIVKTAGIDHVGLGSDFDGVPSLPKGMEHVGKLPNITYELLKRGYADADVKKILGENLLRVMGRVETVASELSATRR